MKIRLILPILLSLVCLFDQVSDAKTRTRKLKHRRPTVRVKVLGGSSPSCIVPYGFTPIQDAQDFAKISDRPSGKFRLCTHISLLQPISSLFADGVKFTGVLDGNGKSIRDVRLTSSLGGRAKPVGLFAEIGEGASIHNLNIEFDGASLQSAGSVGVLAGINAGIISNVRVFGSGNLSVDEIASGVPSDRIGIGGLIGVNRGDVTISSVEGSIKVDGMQNVGGLIGLNRGSLTNSYSGGVAVSGTSSVGGLVGLNVGATLNGVASTGAVNGSSGATRNIGGLVGENINGHILRSSSSSNVTGQENVGGLIGSNTLTIWSSDGEDILISRSASFGNVSGRQNVGGLVGFQRGLFDLSNPINAVILNSVHSVSSWGNVKGLVNVGGLLGQSQVARVIVSYSASKVTPTSASGAAGFGGLIGKGGTSGEDTTIVYGSFFDKTKNPDSSLFSGNNWGIGKTSEELTIIETYQEYGWNISYDEYGFWRLVEGSRSLPRLQ